MSHSERSIASQEIEIDKLRVDRGYPNANDIGVWQNRLLCSCNLLRILLLSPNIGGGYFVSLLQVQE